MQSQLDTITRHFAESTFNKKRIYPESNSKVPFARNYVRVQFLVFESSLKKNF